MTIPYSGEDGGGEEDGLDEVPAEGDVSVRLDPSRGGLSGGSDYSSIQRNTISQQGGRASSQNLVRKFQPKSSNQEDKT